MNATPNDVIRGLIESWCDRREYRPLAIVLPAWTGNNGLTDDWELLLASLKHAYAICAELPEHERLALKKALVDIDYALRNRQ